jgi:hypothetical protein
MATALVAASVMGVSVAAPASASENIDLGRFSVQDRGRSVDWTFNLRCERGDAYRVSIDLTQRNNRRWDARGDARSDRFRCDDRRQRVSLTIRADEGRFTNGRARAEVEITAVRGRDWDRDRNSDRGRDRGRDIRVTQWVELRGGRDNDRAPDGY